MQEAKRSWDLPSDSYKAFNIIADKSIIHADLFLGSSRFSEFKLDPSNMVVLFDKSRSQTKLFNSACIKGFDIASPVSYRCPLTGYLFIPIIVIINKEHDLRW